MKPEINQHNWYALYTRSRAEKKVQEQFNEAGIECYLPLKKVLRQWSDRKKWVEMPVINSYIFVCIHPLNLKEVYKINGVVAYVSDQGRPAVIGCNEIEAMRRTIEHQLAYTIEHHTFRKGETVEITSGPLEGIRGEIIDVIGRQKISICFGPIGYILMVDLGNAEFKKITEEKILLE